MKWRYAVRSTRFSIVSQQANGLEWRKSREDENSVFGVTHSFEVCAAYEEDRHIQFNFLGNSFSFYKRVFSFFSPILSLWFLVFHLVAVPLFTVNILFVSCKRSAIVDSFFVSIKRYIRYCVFFFRFRCCCCSLIHSLPFIYTRRHKNNTNNICECCFSLL